jgi:hypothetical protein
VSEPPVRAAFIAGGDLRRFALVAVALPAGVVAVDQLLWELPALFPFRRTGEWLFYPWLVAKTALLAWCAGRLLGPTLYGWIVFFWGQALVDVQTFHASVGLLGHDWDGLEHSLVAAQAGFLAAWGALGQTALRWRVTSVLLAAAVITLHASSLRLNWGMDALPPLLVISAGLLIICCGALRAAGFRIKPIVPVGDDSLQFGVKHMLIWTAAMAPLLVVVREFDWNIFREFGVFDVVPAALICAGTALASLATVWFVLGTRRSVVRAIVLAAILIVGGVVLSATSAELQQPIYGKDAYQLSVQLYARMQSLWPAWLPLVSGLLAAMLLFLRASGFRLARPKGRRDHLT